MLQGQRLGWEVVVRDGLGRDDDLLQSSRLGVDDCRWVCRLGCDVGLDRGGLLVMGDEESEDVGMAGLHMTGDAVVGTRCAVRGCSRGKGDRGDLVYAEDLVDVVHSAGLTGMRSLWENDTEHIVVKEVDLYCRSEEVRFVTAGVAEGSHSVA